MDLNESTDLYLTEADLIARWKVTPYLLRRWRCEHKGPRYYKIGRQVRYSRADVEAWEKGQAREGGGAPPAPPEELAGALIQ